jgi:hypothetical protein
MNFFKSALLVLLAALVVVLGVLAFQVSQSSQPVGTAESVHTFHEDFPGGVSIGSNIFTLTLSTTTPTTTLTASQVCNNGVILFNQTSASAISTGTVTLPSGASLSQCLPYNGSRFSVALYDNALVGSSSITLVAGASTTLSSDVSSSSLPKVLVGTNASFIQFQRVSSTQYQAYFEQGF